MSASLHEHGSAPIPRLSTTARIYRVPLPPTAVRSMDQRRDTGHRFVMSLLPDELGDTPRASTSTLWRLDEGSTSMRLITRAEIPGLESEPIEPVRAGQAVDLEVVLETVIAKSASIPQPVFDALIASGINPLGTRSGRVRVPDDRLPDWIRKRMTSAGWSQLQVHSLHRRTVERRKTPLCLVEFTASAVVSDPIAANRSLVEGIGRGRSFGAGTVIRR